MRGDGIGAQHRMFGLDQIADAQQSQEQTGEERDSERNVPTRDHRGFDQHAEGEGEKPCERQRDITRREWQ